MHSGRHQYRHTESECDCTTHWDDGPARASFDTPSVPRILQQIYRCCGTERFFVALESARKQRLISRAGLRWLHSKFGSTGRDLIDFSRADAGSGLESLVRLRTRSYAWNVRTQVAVAGTGEVDLLIEDWLIIETDGKDNHDDESHRHRDLMRDANSALWGYVTLRFDYAMVVYEWDLVEAAIVATMAAHARQLPGGV